MQDIINKPQLFVLLMALFSPLALLVWRLDHKMSVVIEQVDEITKRITRLDSQILAISEEVRRIDGRMNTLAADMDRLKNEN